MNLNYTFTMDELDDNMNNQSFISSSWLESGSEYDAQKIQKEIQVRDQKICELKDDKLKLKALLKKAKVAIDGINSKLKSVSEQANLTDAKFQHSKERSKELERKLEEAQKKE